MIFYYYFSQRINNKDGQIHYYKNVGSKSSHSIVDADANSIDYQGPKLNPTKAPSSVVGTDKYYKWRNNDFNVRQGLMDKWHTWQPSPPDYYMDYGDKYVKRFSKDLRPKLSTSGQGWLDRALVNLQTAIEMELRVNPKIELSNSGFKKFAFNSHVSAYEDAGLFNLPISDLLQIGTTPDMSDMLSPNGLRQVKQVGIDYMRQAKENPIPTTIRAAEFGIRIWQYYNNKKKND
jgi:hypothetical protein